MNLSQLSAPEREEALAIIERCMVDRIFFVEEVLGVKDVYQNEGGDIIKLCRDEEDLIPPGYEFVERGIEDWQYNLMIDMDEGATQVSIRSAVGVGKTTVVSWLALHFLLFRDDVKVIATSPSFNQLQDGIIPEVRKWVQRLPTWMKDQLLLVSERISRKPDTENNFISFRTARKETPEALQGIHATHVLLLVDEASGVDEVVYEAGSGTMSTKGAITVLISNATRVSGLFYRTQTKLKHIWTTYVVTAFQSTRVQKSFPQKIADMFGLNSTQYKMRVLAQFPEGNADSIVPRAWVEEAYERTIYPTGRAIKIWGVDPGRGGDPTGFCERCGTGITMLKEWNDDNTMLVVGHLKVMWDELTPSERPIAIYVDVIGIGAGVGDRLLEMGLPVVQVNVAELAALKERYVRMRAELWYSAREFFEKKDCWISKDLDVEVVTKFIDEVSEARMKDHSSGRFDVESKKDMKARGIPSPNLADAFNLTLGEDASMMNGVNSGNSDWNKALGYKYRGAA